MLKEFSKLTVAITLTVDRITLSTENTMLFVVTTNKTKPCPWEYATHIEHLYLKWGPEPVLLEPRKETCL